jgi:hypothetical protein
MELNMCTLFSSILVPFRYIGIKRLCLHSILLYSSLLAPHYDTPTQSPILKRYFDSISRADFVLSEERRGSLANNQQVISKLHILHLMWK